MRKLFVCTFCLIFLCIHRLSGVNIAIEGMPGGGKTSSLISLISELPGDFVLFSETNPEANSDWKHLTVNTQGGVYHKLWVDRMDCVEKLSRNKDLVFLFDRSYFSNLAFKYALDALSNDGFFSDYFEIFRKDLEEKKFDLIIILNVDPRTSLNRRRTVDEVPYPWSEKRFLEAFQEFYIEKLPKITSSPIVLINTDNLSQAETKLKIKEQLNLFSDTRNTKKYSYENQIERLFLEFAEQNQLGEGHSEVVEVFACPTMYFLQHSIQFVNGEIIFFNNKRLIEIVKNALN